MSMRVPSPMYTLASFVTPGLPRPLDGSGGARSARTANLSHAAGRSAQGGRFPSAAAGNTRAMIAFFIILALLMVFVAMAGRWSAAGPRRRVIYDRDVVADRRPGVAGEEIVDDPYPVARSSRRVVRRRRY